MKSCMDWLGPQRCKLYLGEGWKMLAAYSWNVSNDLQYPSRNSEIPARQIGLTILMNIQSHIHMNNSMWHTEAILAWHEMKLLERKRGYRCKCVQLVKIFFSFETYCYFSKLCTRAVHNTKIRHLHLLHSLHSVPACILSIPLHSSHQHQNPHIHTQH